MADLNIGEIAATTLEIRSPDVADNMLDNIAYLNVLKQKGRIKPVSGGNVDYEAIAYQDTSGFDWYSGWDPLATTQVPVVDVLQFSLKQCAVPVMMSGREELQNMGEEQVIDLLDEKIENSERTMKNNMEVGLFSDGTGTGGDQIEGLQLFIGDTPSSGTIGGVAASNSFWQNIAYDVSSSTYATFTSATAQSIINNAYVQAVRGNDAPNAAFADNNYFVPFLESLQAMQRVTNDKTARLGFTSVWYMNMEVFLAGGRQGACPSNHFYMVNMDYIKFRPHRRRNMVPLKRRDSFNQDGFIQYLTWAGYHVITNRFLQVVVKQ
jgi:hypothetical protein